MLVRRRLDALEDHAGRLTAARERLLREAPAHQGQLAGLFDRAARTIRDLQPRYQVKLWQLELLRWQIDLEQIAADWETLGVTEVDARLRRLAIIRSEGEELQNRWLAEEPGLGKPAGGASLCFPICLGGVKSYGRRSLAGRPSPGSSRLVASPATTTGCFSIPGYGENSAPISTALPLPSGSWNVSSCGSVSSRTGSDCFRRGASAAQAVDGGPPSLDARRKRCPSGGAARPRDQVAYPTRLVW